MQALYYTFVGMNYGFTALKWGWIPLIVFLGASSVYCEPTLNIKRDVRQYNSHISMLCLGALSADQFSLVAYI